MKLKKILILLTTVMLLRIQLQILYLKYKTVLKALTEQNNISKK